MIGVMAASEWYAIICGLLTFLCVLRWLTWRKTASAHDVGNGNESSLYEDRQGLDFDQWARAGAHLKVTYAPRRAAFGPASITPIWQSDLRNTGFCVPIVIGGAIGDEAHEPVRVAIFQGTFSAAGIWRC